MSRTQAAGKMNWKIRSRSGGQITSEQVLAAVRDFGVELRGAGTDESPLVYQKLQRTPHQLQGRSLFNVDTFQKNDFLNLICRSP